ncbi:DUF4292 domain-containing protein [Elizabethkingia argentiflava]|uniref:DUF4292 domain-containing protein n=1 Tax=Elizabethkingia argenteiflava TaxID=2681556 RepID=A0A845PTF1_9FLAO|nr:DUF4292 domain-containing protein [Elizabethkingia argenteiflava]NAW51512.1 DUF4292 domain-containing protein [Elizabethkingia argenteiflava]
MKTPLLYILAAASLASCATTHIAKESTPHTKSVEQPLKDNTSFFKHIQNTSNFDAVKISSTINIENGKFIPQLNATFYIENNRKVWANITALLGITGARGIATPTGIKGYEKLNKTYIDSDFSYLNNLLGVSFINYKALQNLLLGKTFLPINPQDFILTQTEQGYHLKSSSPQQLNVDGKVSSYDISMDYDPLVNLSKVQINTVESDHQLEINYSNWIHANQENFPKNVKIIIKNKKTDQILIENTNFDFSKMQTPYSVPPNYTKKEIK